MLCKQKAMSVVDVWKKFDDEDIGSEEERYLLKELMTDQSQLNSIWQENEIGKEHTTKTDFVIRRQSGSTSVSIATPPATPIVTTSPQATATTTTKKRGRQPSTLEQEKEDDVEELPKKVRRTTRVTKNKGNKYKK